jgi:hypothetical protein
MAKCFSDHVLTSGFGVYVIGMGFPPPTPKSKIGVALIWICFLVGNGAVVAT